MNLNDFILIIQSREIQNALFNLKYVKILNILVVFGKHQQFIVLK